MIVTENIVVENNLELLSFLKESLSIYDQTLYFLRQQYFEYKKGNKTPVLNYNGLYRLVKETDSFKNSTMDFVVKQNVIRQVSTTWNNWIKSIVSYNKTPNKFKTKPKLPKYLHNRKLYNKIVVDSSRIRNKGCGENEIRLPKSSFKVKLPKYIKKENIKCLEIVKYYNKIKINIVYEKNVEQISYKNDRCMGIDVGLNNLLAITINNLPLSMIVKGGKIKSINQFFNKTMSNIESELMSKNKKYMSKKLMNTYMKRNNKIDTYFHQLSRYIIDWCVDNQVSKIIIGHNKGWKQHMKLKKYVKKKFVEVPFNRLISYLKYKSELVGIEFIETEEAYTSKADHLMFEEMKHLDKRSGKRTKRGLFVSGYNHKFINADINGAIGMLRKRTGLTDEQLMFLRDRGDVVSPKVLFI